MGAKTYTEYTLAAPTTPAAALAAGGSLSIGTTYYYHIVSARCAGFSSNGITRINCESPPSAEVSATPDASNRTINLTWDAMAGAAYYLVIRTTVSGDYSLATCRLVFTTANTPITTNSYSDNGARIYDNWREYPAGLPCVQLDGGSSSDYIDEDWIYTQMTGGSLGAFVTRIQDSAGAITLGYVFRCSFALGSTSGNPTYFSITQGRMIIVNGRWDNTQSHLTVRFGTTEGSMGVEGPCIQFLGKTYSSGGQSFPVCNGVIYGTRFIDYMSDRAAAETEATGYWSYRPIVSQFGNSSASKLTVKNSTLGVTHTGAFGGYVDVIDCTLDYNLYLFPGSPAQYNSQGGYVSAGNCYSYNYSIEVNDIVFRYLFTDFMYHGTAQYKTVIYRNCTSYNSPPTGTGITNPTYTRYYIMYSLDLTVVDDAGTAISDATVAIEDVNGYNCVWLDSGATLGEEIAPSEVSGIAVSDSSKISVGDIIMINLEKMTVTASGSNEITVTRSAFEDTWQPGGRYHWYTVGTVNSPIYKRAATATTNVNGAIETQKFMIKSHYDYDAGGPASYKYSETAHGPYKITISKAGYETLVLNNVLFSTKAQWRVELQSAMKMDLDGNLFMSSDADSPLLPL